MREEKRRKETRKKVAKKKGKSELVVDLCVIEEGEGESSISIVLNLKFDLLN